jgi:hypothetical protein
MDDKIILWLLDEDHLVEIDTDVNPADLPDGSAVGIFDGDELIMDFNKVERPVNMGYFIRLWNAQFTSFPLTIDQIIFNLDGEHHKFKKQTTRKVSMPPINVPAGKKLKAVGDLGESLLSLIPGLQVVRPLKTDGVHDVDYEIVWNGQTYGAEVKTNARTNVDPYRYKLTGYGLFSLADIRRLKTAFCEQNGVTPAMLGITIDFEANTFDACLLPGEIRTFLGGANTVIAKGVSFETTGVVPLQAEQRLDRRVPKPFQRPGETGQPSWKKRLVPAAPEPSEVF